MALAARGSGGAPARPRLAALLSLWLALTAVARPAAAQCEEGDDSASMGCVKCSADNSRCEQCTERRVLTAEGQCARCNATHISGWQESCAACRADDPTICLKCDDYCSTSGCIGHYVTREGHCSRCPEGAAACADLTGKIRRCRAGLGLVGGECRRCKVEGCHSCDGDLWTCTKCITPKSESDDGFFPDPAMGACVPCDKGCKACKRRGACLDCTLTVLDPARQMCLSCSDPKCNRCVKAVDKCSECLKGYRVDEASNTCVPCSVANCDECNNENKCRQCMLGYGLVNPQGDSIMQYSTACHACAKADPNCLACNGDPAVCSRCAQGMGPDPASGLCVPCRHANASTYGSCSRKDATRCDYGSDCADGFFCHNVTGQCTPCAHIGCRQCEDGAQPGECTSCLPGYWDASEPINNGRYRASTVEDRSELTHPTLDELPTECQPCIDKHCLVCDISYGAACEVCSDGYFLDRRTKRCRACTEPEGALYETCAPAPAPAPAPAAA